jgi:hypothetical protein
MGESSEPDDAGRKVADGPSHGTRSEKSWGPVGATLGKHDRPPGTAL